MSHRAAIFQLRAQVDPETGRPLSLQKIADTLGVSKSLVAKELRRPATTAVPDEQRGPGELVNLPATAMGPELLQANESLAAERAELARLELRLKRTQLERQMELLAQPGQGNSAALMMLVESQMRELRAEIARLQQQRVTPAAPAAPPPPPANPLDVLQQARQTWDMVQSMAPPKPPSTADELEMRLALDRINLEREERMRKLDADLDERRRELENARIRSEAIAAQIAQWGPVIGAGIQEWLSRGGGSSQPLIPPNPNPAPGPRPGITVLSPERGAGITLGMIEGDCPGCGAAIGIRPEGNRSERCPRCTMELVVVNGRIEPKLPEDSLPRFAS